MSAETQLILGRDPLPPHVQALLDLTHEAHAAPPWRRWLKDHNTSVALILCYTLTAFLYLWADPSASAPILFLAALAVMFSLHAESENKARQRLQLVLKVLREQPVANQKPTPNEVLKPEA